jgi:biotin carboxyl carrier protein
VVIAVHVAADDVVEAGQDLVIIESMKTEQIVKSPRQGTVQRVSVQEGDRVDRGMRLVVLVPLSEE